MDQFLLSLFVYSLLGWGMYFLAKTCVVNNGRTIAKKKYTLPLGYILCILLYAFIVGVRWNVGVDWESYYDHYETSRRLGYLTVDTEHELGYAYIIKLLSGWGLHYAFFFGFFAFLQVLFIALTFKDEPKIFSFAVLVLVFGDYFFASMTLVRQMTVVCSFLWVAKFINERKIIWFVVWFIAAFSIHRTSIVAAPFFLLYLLNKDWTNRKIIYITIFACIIIGYTPNVIGWLQGSGRLLEFATYENYADRLADLTEQDQLTEMAWGPIKLGKLILQLIIIGFYPRMTVYYKSDILKLYFKLYVIGTCAFYIVSNTSHMFIRPTFYLTIFMLPMTAYLLRYLYVHRANLNYKQYYYICLILAIIPTYWQLLKALRSSGVNTIFYQFCFGH